MLLQTLCLKNAIIRQTLLNPRLFADLPARMVSVDIEKGKYYRLIRRIWIGFLTLWLTFALYLLAVSVDLLGLFGPMPGFRLLDNPRNDLASEVYSADGVLLGKYFTENRSPVEYEALPEALVQALIATEDVRFAKHSGVDLKGTFAILWYYVQGDRRGSSTISQQLAKNLYQLREVENRGLLHNVPLLNMFIIKTKEWITAVNLERNYTKAEIIKLYLNTVEFGSHAYGIDVAAQTFFGKEPRELNVQESALLVGLLKSPSIYSPVRHPKQALARRNVVLDQMQKYGYLSATTCLALQQTILGLHYQVQNQHTGLAAYFRSYLSRELLAWAKQRDIDLYADGLKIYTTIDSRLQQLAEQAVAGHMSTVQAQFFRHWQGRNPWVDAAGQKMKDYVDRAIRRSPRYRALVAQYGGNEDSIRIVLHTRIPMRVFSWAGEKDTLMSPVDSVRYYKHFLQTGFMAMEPNSGHVKAWVGGIDHTYFQYDHVRQGRRQPGSAFKPFIYAAAMDIFGYVPCDRFFDIAPAFPEYGGWVARNYSRTYSDTMITLRTALAQSKNTIPAYLIKQMGAQTVVDYAKKLGITSLMRPLPSICLGTEPVSVYDLTGAYSTFANGGVWTKPFYLTRIEDKNGNLLQTFSPVTREVMHDEKAYLMLHVLQGAVREPGGSARGLYRYNVVQTNDVGAKTGTSQNYADGWFVGVTQGLVGSVWVGGDDMNIRFRDANGLGSRTALPIWGRFMDSVYADTTLGIKKLPFIRPRKLSVTLDCQQYQKAILVSDSTRQYIPPRADSLKNEGFL